ncbi:MAG: hypothetical protein ACI89L_002781 [Phycisphaerales bacterium]|jgi:hypothetical protein
MALTLPLFAILALGFLAAVACLMLLHTTACVIQNEARVWDLRNDVERLHFDYQLQLHRMQSTGGGDDGEVGMMDIVEDPVAA